MTAITNTTRGITTATATPGSAMQKAASSVLGNDDFMRLMVEQLKQQDPTDPVDNKDMLAQMAQFSALAGSNEANVTLQAIADKLDALIDAQSGLKALLQPDAPAAGEPAAA